MSGIFISYRRQDGQGSAGRLADTLKAQFANNQIFRDIETIEPGVDFVEAIERALGSCVNLEVSVDGHVMQGAYVETTTGATVPILLRR